MTIHVQAARENGAKGRICYRVRRSNEGHGLSFAVLPPLTGGLRIPMEAGVESLNVATAGANVLYSIFGQQLLA